MIDTTNLRTVSSKILKEMIKVKSKEINKYKEDLKQIVELLDKHNIEYWSDYGTLLGIIRDNDFIPWDDDIDLGCFFKEVKKIYRLEDEVKSIGWKFIIKYDQVTFSNGITKIDIFFYSRFGGSIKTKFISFKNQPILIIDSLLSMLHLNIFCYKSEKRLSIREEQIIK